MCLCMLMVMFSRHSSYFSFGHEQISKPQSYHELKFSSSGYHHLLSTRVIVFCLFSFFFSSSVAEWKSSKHRSKFSPINR